MANGVPQQLQSAVQRQRAGRGARAGERRGGSEHAVAGERGQWDLVCCAGCHQDGRGPAYDRPYFRDRAREARRDPDPVQLQQVHAVQAGIPRDLRTDLPAIAPGRAARRHQGDHLQHLHEPDAHHRAQLLPGGQSDRLVHQQLQQAAQAGGRQPVRPADQDTQDREPGLAHPVGQAAAAAGAGHGEHRAHPGPAAVLRPRPVEADPVHHHHIPHKDQAAARGVRGQRRDLALAAALPAKAVHQC